MQRAHLQDRLAAQRAARAASPGRPAFKVNLYTGLETHATARAARALAAAGEAPALECVMVGDSYLMTHLGRDSTRIIDPVEQRWALDALVGLLGEVRQAVDAESWPGVAPWLMGDFPDGAAVDLATAAAAAERMAAVGADAIKVELADEADWSVLEGLGRRGWATIAHLGYAPQHGTNRRYGGDLAEARALFAAARRARDAGAVALVLERVDPAVHARIASPHPHGLPVYAIFSGAAAGTAQNLNVWDAVVHPDRPRQAFPPTAVLTRAQTADAYGEELVADRLAALIRLATLGRYPIQRSTLEPQVQDALRAMPVWEA